MEGRNGGGGGHCKCAIAHMSLSKFHCEHAVVGELPPCKPSDIVADLGIKSCDIVGRTEDPCIGHPVEQNELKLLHYHYRFAVIMGDVGYFVWNNVLRCLRLCLTK